MIEQSPRGDVQQWNRQHAKEKREEAQRKFAIARERDPEIQEVVVQRRLNVGGSPRGDRGKIEMREVHAERFVVPQRLEIETKDAQDERGEDDSAERGKPRDAAQMSTP